MAYSIFRLRVRVLDLVQYAVGHRRRRQGWYVNILYNACGIEKFSLAPILFWFLINTPQDGLFTRQCSGKEQLIGLVYLALISTCNFYSCRA